MKDLLFGSAAVSGFKANLSLAVLRVFAGLTMAFVHGVAKMPPPEGLVNTISAIGFPSPITFAWCAAFAEFGGGVLLALGLATRPAAFFILVTMLVASFGAHGSAPFTQKEASLMFAAVSLMFMGVGAGRFSIDSFLSKPR